jgi:hypothetical protein
MLPNFGKGSIEKHNLDLIMMINFNAKLRTWDEIEALACVSRSFSPKHFFLQYSCLGSKADLKLIECHDFGDNGVMIFKAA